MTDPNNPRPNPDDDALDDWKSRAEKGAGYWTPGDGALTSPVCRQFRDHWIALCGDRRLPERGDFDPINVTSILPHILLVDVLAGPDGFRYRLIGTFVTEMAGRNATGKTVDAALYGKNLDAVLWPLIEVKRRRAPIALLSGVLFADRDWHCIDHIWVPFGNKTDGLVTIAGCLDINREKAVADLPGGLVLDWRL